MKWEIIFKEFEPRLISLSKNSSDGTIHINQIYDIIEDIVGIDNRTKKNIIDILVRRELLTRVSPKVFYYLPYADAHPEKFKRETDPPEFGEVK